ncbi:MAG: damage endonuclease [Actinomycetota bacterium]|nr:damage endonuclease [Actinomycetota bacterium]
MKLGFAVKVLGREGLRSHDTRRWQSDPDLGTSIGYLHRIFDYLEDIDVRMYRMASGIAPYASHPQHRHFRDQPTRFSKELRALGDRAREAGLRLSMHPGQYTVLNSHNEATVHAAVEELEVHAEILEAMALERESVIVLHVGGLAGDREDAKARFEKGFALLSERAQTRLVLENDDRLFGLSDVLDIAARTGCPVVWDVLHHHCFDPDHVPDDEALRLAMATWPKGVRPKIHYSTPKTSMQVARKKVGRRTVSVPLSPPLRAHADLIDPIGFEWFMREVVRDLNIDIMLEAKGKDLALLKLREHLAERNLYPESSATSTAKSPKRSAAGG